MYVEELLEIEVEIFNLPVYGDTQVDVKEAVDLQQQPDEQITCYACAASLLITASARKEGYIGCKYCHTITLLYTQAEHMLPLGQLEPKQMQYKVASKGERAGVLHKGSNQVVLALMGRKIIKSPYNSSAQGELVSRIGIQKIPISTDLNLEDYLRGILSGDIVNQLDQELAYSEQTDFADEPIYMRDILAKGSVKYIIVAQIANKMQLLIPNIEDLSEGAIIVTLLNNYLESIS